MSYAVLKICRPYNYNSNWKLLLSIGCLAFIIFLCCSSLAFFYFYSNFYFLPQQLVSGIVRDSDKTIDWFNAELDYKYDDENLVKIARYRKTFLQPPSIKKYDFSHSLEVDSKSLENEMFDTSCGQIEAVKEILESLTPGFFVECGALDGILRSNTLLLERKFGWSGLLVEANPSAFKNLQMVHRKAWTSSVCLSTEPFARKVDLYVGGDWIWGVSGLIKSRLFGQTKPLPVQCIPLTTLLLALNRTTVDYFSLDVEGNELDILKTIPFDRFTFKVVNVEHNHVPGGKRQLRKFMEGKGFNFFRTVVKFTDAEHSCTADSIFLHKSIEVPQILRSFIGHQDPENVTWALRE